jgi:hypothetical protein
MLTTLDIPAKAGIQLYPAKDCMGIERLDPGFRRDDEHEVAWT